MTDETFMLILLVIVMLVGSYMAGSIPLIMKLSEEKLNFITVLGAGLLVGTALAVIIPEGIRSLYINGDTTNHVTSQHSEKGQLDFTNTPLSTTHVPEDHSRTIGLSLVLGFVFMMLVDQISQQRQRNSNNRKGHRNYTATLGLVVHAAADGVALGAAATTSHQDVEIIVFIAIMLHKAPAAFGLVSFLLHEKVDRKQIRQHLAIFSLSAPLLTMLTYFGIGQEQKETLNTVKATGISMLFSGGTFLYVATVHVLPELTQNTGHQHVHKGAQHIHSQYEYRALEEAADDINTETLVAAPNPSTSSTFKNYFNCFKLTTLICGALLPLLITISHQH